LALSTNGAREHWIGSEGIAPERAIAIGLGVAT
jgi:hypothetical protein